MSFKTCLQIRLCQAFLAFQPSVHFLPGPESTDESRGETGKASNMYEEHRRTLPFFLHREEGQMFLSAPRENTVQIAVE